MTPNTPEPSAEAMAAATQLAKYLDNWPGDAPACIARAMQTYADAFHAAKVGEAEAKVPELDAGFTGHYRNGYDLGVAAAFSALRPEAPR
jgi:hypothetical protein